QQCLRVPGPTFTTMVAAAFTGGFFIFATYAWYTAALVSAVLALVTILYWLWTGTAIIPEKKTKDVGLGLRLPLYGSGPKSVGWWATFITMIGDMTAFISLVFGYFFFWTVHEDFPPQSASGPGIFWPGLAAGILLLSWLLTLGARQFNRREQGAVFYGALGLAALLNIAGAASLLAGPLLSEMDPTRHAYEATVWVLVSWT